MVDITDKSDVNGENYVPVPGDTLKEEQKKEYEELVEKFKRKCLKSYSITRSGDVIKKFNLPSFQPLTEAQCDNNMIMRLDKLWHRLSSRVQQSWATHYIMRWSRLLLKARF
jgi:glutathione peroxidase-family protein